MEIPALFDWANPTAPKWSTVGLTRDELDSLFEVLVMFLGYDPRPGADDPYVILGSGFLVSAKPYLTVLTAAHIFIWWTDQIEPPKPHGLRGVQGDKEDLDKRLRRVFESGHIVAGVTPRGWSEGCICRVVGLSLDPHPAHGDIAVLQLSVPEGRGDDDFRTLPVDSDRFDFREPVVMAGFTGGGRRICLDDEQLFGRAYYEQEIRVLAGRVGELISGTRDHPHRNMYRVNIPSWPGMSGGPLILLRRTDNVVGPDIVPTAAGVISSSAFEEPILLNHCESGETWVMPAALSFARKVATPDGRVTISDAIKAGYVDAVGYAAHHAIVERDPVTGITTYSLDKSR
jgi:hypothetical protein